MQKDGRGGNALSGVISDIVASTPDDEVIKKLKPPSQINLSKFSLGMHNLVAEK